MKRVVLVLSSLYGLGCTTTEEAAGVAVLGGGSHSLERVERVEIASAGDGLILPTDLAFNPAAPDELWITNRGDESFVVIDRPGAADRAATKYRSPSGNHFLAQPTSLAFSANGNFATCHEEDQPTQGELTPSDFMGPTLWSSDRALMDGGEMGHIDMLHNSPLSVGIAWERDNAFWVLDGLHASLTRYDFRTPHEHGGIDHTDGITYRYAEGQMGYQPGLPAHLWFDQAQNKLYAADPLQHRIVVLDPSTATPGPDLQPNYDMSEQKRMDGATLTTLVDLLPLKLAWPSGLAHDGEHLFVADTQTGTIAAFTLDGELVDYLALGLPDGALMGLEIDAAGRLYYLDNQAGRVMRLSPEG